MRGSWRSHAMALFCLARWLAATCNRLTYAVIFAMASVSAIIGDSQEETEDVTNAG